MTNTHRQTLKHGATFAWAVLTPIGRGWANEGEPLADNVRPTRDTAIQAFADSWRTRDEAADHHSIVWRRAYRRGWRVARVVITRAFGESK